MPEMTPEKLRDELFQMAGFVQAITMPDKSVVADSLRELGIRYASAWEADRVAAEWKRAFDKGEVAGMHSDSAETDNPFPEGGNEYCGWSFGFYAERDRRAHKRLEKAESRIEALERDLALMTAELDALGSELLGRIGECDSGDL